jgi:hypothetical protein
MGLKPKLTYATSINPPEDFSKDEVNSRYPNIPQDFQGHKMEKPEDLRWSPPTQRQEEIDHRLLEDTPLVVRRHLKESQPMHTTTLKKGFY